jgi:hypothetical protein
MQTKSDPGIKLALLGELLKLAREHALSQFKEGDEPDGDEGAVIVMDDSEPDEDDSKLDEKSKRLKRLKALAGE